ncbi:hypothetical protein ABFS82_09G101000 [Erythranthe guttata]|uniref:thionin-like protein 1 n=1 Tax=Erythranthe guttata TaxID=4155 RepID=UPI00064D7D07|nr:PREDICTED: thionin-like protein 1 [Erythranthe guttata]|eukprot:XP_012856272.1 PREDICTED: thionin-like protein 1 [Erythranthe guttata]
MGKSGRNVQAIAAGLMVLLLIAGQQQKASASLLNFKFCFASCAVGCLFGDNKFGCVLKCFPKCLLGVRPLNELDNELQNCTLGCALDRCAPLVYDFKIEDIDKVANCVDECDIGQCGYVDQSGTSQVLSPNEAPSPI